MAKGDGDRRADEARRKDRTHGFTWVKTGRGKNADRKKVYNKNPYDLTSGAKKKTKDFSYKGEGPKKFIAGANVIDQATGKVGKRASFDEHLKSTGNRADDPRNWEFHYKAPNQAFSTRGKNDQRVDNRAGARRTAERKAKREGKEIYKVQKIEYSTEGIKAGTKASAAKSKAMGGASAFGSTQVATNVVAQRQKASRRTGRAAARGPNRGAIA